MRLDAQPLERRARGRGADGRDGLAKADDGARGVAEIGEKRAALHLADADVGRRQLLAQRRIGDAVVLAQPIEIAQGGIDDELARGRRAWNRPHHVVDVEDDDAGKLAEIFESSRRDLAPATC